MLLLPFAIAFVTCYCYLYKRLQTPALLLCANCNGTNTTDNAPHFIVSLAQHALKVFFIRACFFYSFDRLTCFAAASGHALTLPSVSLNEFVYPIKNISLNAYSILMIGLLFLFNFNDPDYRLRTIIKSYRIILRIILYLIDAKNIYLFFKFSLAHCVKSGVMILFLSIWFLLLMAYLFKVILFIQCSHGSA